MKRQEFISLERARKKNKTDKSTNEAEIIYQITQFKTLVIRMVTSLGKRIDEHSEDFNKELDNTKKNYSKVKTQ